VAICAESMDAARKAADLIELDVAEEPLGTNRPNKSRVSTRGDVERGLRDADVTITREYRTPTALHTALEPHGAVCDWIGDHLTIWESTQGIFNTRSDVASALGLPLSRVRVLKSYMGGGFGAKN